MSEQRRARAFLAAHNWLHFAAAPTFAVMALVAAVAASRDVPCSAAHDASPLTGMVAMYVLMSIFHSWPWLKLIAGWRNRRAGGRSLA